MSDIDLIRNGFRSIFQRLEQQEIKLNLLLESYLVFKKCMECGNSPVQKLSIDFEHKQIQYDCPVCNLTYREDFK